MMIKLWKHWTVVSGAQRSTEEESDSGEDRLEIKEPRGVIRSVADRSERGQTKERRRGVSTVSGGREGSTE
jgi:hypothetical protein